VLPECGCEDDLVNPGEVDIIIGTRTWEQGTVGSLGEDGSVYAGTHSWDRVVVGSVDVDGVVYSGASSWSRTRVGSVEADGTVFSGSSAWDRQRAGVVGVDGTVSRQAGGDVQMIGKVVPADRRAGAALVLLLEHVARPESPSDQSSTFPPPDHGKARGNLGAFAAGALAGVAAQRKHDQQKRKQLNPQQRHSQERDAQLAAAAARLREIANEVRVHDERLSRPSLAEVLADEAARPGSHPQNTTPVAGAVSRLATPEADIVQPDPAIPPNIRFGADVRADDEARSILAHLRSFSDHESIDGPYGVATQWERHLNTLEELRQTYTRYLDLADLVHRFMT
jgi:hypothetical protein